MDDHLFICYSKDDKDFVLRLGEALKAREIPIWFDLWSLSGGEDWDNAINDAIRRCREFLIVLSPASVISREVRGELRLALDEKKQIIPFLYKDCEIPRQIRNIHHFDLTQDGSTLESILDQFIQERLNTDSKQIVHLELKLAQPMAHFDQEDFRRELERLVGVKLENVTIVKITRGSVIVKISGNSEELARIARKLEEASQELGKFQEQTKLINSSVSLEEGKKATKQSALVRDFNQFRSKGLGSLLDDLLELEETGLTDSQCQQVRLALGKIVNASAAIPDGSWLRGSVFNELEAFEHLYIQWNGHTTAEQRKETLGKMRKRRQRIAQRIRKNQYILSEELDLNLLKSIYDSLGQLSKDMPRIFPNLSSAMKNFQIKFKISS